MKTGSLMTAWRIVIVAFFSSLVVSSSDTQAQGWSAIINVSDNLSQSLLSPNGSKAITTTNGEVFVAYYDDADGDFDIYLGSSRDGINWKITNVSSTSTGEIYPSIDSKEGLLAISWTTSDSIPFTDSLYQFLADTTLANPLTLLIDSRVRGPSSTEFAKESAYIYATARSATIPPGYKQWIWKIHPDSGVVSSIETLDAFPASSIGVTRDERILVAHNFHLVPRTIISYRIYDRDFGLTGFGLMDDASEYNPCVASTDSSFYVAWEHFASGVGWDIRYRKVNSDGTSGPIMVAASINSFEDGSPSIATEGDSTVHIVWSEYRDGDFDIFHKLYNEREGWSKETNVSNSDGPSIRPHITLDAAGNVFVMWQDSLEGDWDVYIRSRCAPSTTANSREPSVAVTSLRQNYPNPFNPSTRIKFELVEPDFISLSIYTLEGQVVRVLARGLYEAGVHEVDWDGSSKGGDKLPSGIYFCVLRSQDTEVSRKMVLLK